VETFLRQSEPKESREKGGGEGEERRKGEGEKERGRR